MVFTRKFSEFPSGTLTENVGLAGDVNTRGPASAGGGSVTEVITQDTSGLAVGRWVRFDTVTNLYVHGLADTAQNAEIAGVVLNILNPNQFTLQQAGPIPSGTPGFNGFTPGIYFLSDTLLGEQTLTPPTTNGHINKPLFDADSADSGWVICLERGAVIGTPGPIPASAGGTDSNIHTIDQPGNTFNVGDWVRVSGDTVYSLADGTSLANAQSVGVVIAAGDPNFTVQFSGWNSNTVINAVDALGNVIPIVSATVYYLSDVVGSEGKITPTPPALATHASRPVFISESAISGTGWVLPQRPLLDEATQFDPSIIPVHQVAHGFANGDVARISAINTYVKAQADSAVHALPVGFVEYVDPDNFILHTAGYSDMFVPPFTPLTPSLRYFLSPTIAGGITLTEPTGPGQYSVPMLIALNPTTGYILEQRPLSTASLNPSGNVFLGYLNAANNFSDANIFTNNGGPFNAYFILVERGANNLVLGINGTSGGPNVSVGFQIYMNGAWSTGLTYGVIGGGYKTVSNTNVATAWGMAYTGAAPSSADSMFILPPTSRSVSLNSGYAYIAVGTAYVGMNFNMFASDYSNLPVSATAYSSVGFADDAYTGPVTGLRIFFDNGVLTPGSAARIAVYGIPNS
jgi:hypothetical protein